MGATILSAKAKANPGTIWGTISSSVEFAAGQQEGKDILAFTAVALGTRYESTKEFGTGRGMAKGGNVSFYAIAIHVSVMER